MSESIVSNANGWSRGADSSCHIVAVTLRRTMKFCARIKNRVEESVRNKTVKFDVWSYFPANIRLDEDVLKTFFVFVLRKRLDQDEYIRPSLTCLQDVLVKTNIFILAIRRLAKIFSRRFQDIVSEFQMVIGGLLQTTKSKRRIFLSVIYLRL